MNNVFSFQLPRVTDNDIDWVCDVLKLPASAFAGADGQDPRLAVLKSTESLDIEACPGSGKTTLLVAKLAILSRAWIDPRRGICVVSHTNVARREIEKHLGNTAAGQRLLGYPHYVGTIHGFVNEFLALPWLRSLGFPIRAIDSALCEQHRRRLLAQPQFKTLSIYVKNKEEAIKGAGNIVGRWSVATPEFVVLKGKGEPEFKNPEGTAAKQLVTLARKCADDGYHCYDEMFMWAHDLLDKRPEMIPALRNRFPMLFIDEVQDNQETQSKILHRLFLEGDNPAKRQRYGDSNQAIFDNTEQHGATTDTFPIAEICKAIPNSHRFGQQIGDLANPLALVPHNLVGSGPRAGGIVSDTTGCHALFLFDDASLEQVIENYARYLCEIFTPTELSNGDFTAVAAVHKPKEKDDNVPRHIGKYWPAYDPALTPAEPKPATLHQYIMAGRKRAEQHGESHFATEKIAEGFFRLAQIADPLSNFGARKRRHRQLLELLAHDSNARAAYLNLVMNLAVERGPLIKSEWEDSWCRIASQIITAIAGVIPDSPAAVSFLAWCDHGQGETSMAAPARDNIFRYPSDAPLVKIRVGSIHSVKGETHTATLVLDSFFKKHHLSALKPWLLGQRTGKGKEGPEACGRLKLHYVAMTRPTHLLCMAIREDALIDGDVASLTARGWRVARVRAEGYEWIS